MIGNLLASNDRLILAIDGRAASGKTTLADRLAKERGASVVHMDHFFLQAHQRTKERLDTAGGNVDYERFLEEIAAPLLAGLPFSYRPFDCQKMAMGAIIHIDATPLTIVEGAYACHPALWDLYDLRVFLTIDKEEQRRRIVERNGEQAAQMFFERWIPMEEHYISSFNIPERCDLVIG